ncbi:MAG: peptidylprolyl isomerase [Clostridia bacterium]|nr:peptidylprolyl isomerase [Clostridia bacterium]
MAKKKKNANYVTEKTESAKLEREATEKKEHSKKTVKTVLILFLVAVLIVGLVIGLGFALGLFDYYPEATYHLSMVVEDYGAVHIELYGNDAPKTVEAFTKLCEDGYFDGKSLHTFLDGLLYCGSLDADGGKNGIKGEFSDNGVTNKISHKKGIISLAHGEGADSGYGQFFIVTEDSPELDGKYAAFAMITDGMDIIEKIIEDADMDENGLISIPTRAYIESISGHAHH